MLTLFRNTYQLIIEVQNKRNENSFKDAAEGFYEELINNYNKIEHAYEVNDYQTALFAASEINFEIDDALKDRGVDMSLLPDLVGAYNPKDLSKMLEVSRLHQITLRKLLEDQGVFIQEFNDFNAFKKFFDTL